MLLSCTFTLFFFFNDTATTEIYTLSLHDALPIWSRQSSVASRGSVRSHGRWRLRRILHTCVCSVDRKSTRLNSSHGYISYAVFCLKKKKTEQLTYVLRYCSVTTSDASLCPSRGRV